MVAEHGFRWRVDGELDVAASVKQSGEEAINRQTTFLKRIPPLKGLFRLPGR